MCKYKHTENLEISHVVAVDKVYGIAKDGEIPWNSPHDMRWFRLLTTGNPVIMGRKTYENIFEKIGGPLPNRLNFVLTKRNHYSSDRSDLFFVQNISSAFFSISSFDEATSKKVFIIGGESIYNQTKRYGLIDKIYMSKIPEEGGCDKFYHPQDMWVDDDNSSKKMRGLYEAEMLFQRGDLKILKWYKK